MFYLPGALPGEMTAHAESAVPYQPPCGGPGPRPLPRYRTRPVSLREHVQQPCGVSDTREGRWEPHAP